MFGEFDPINLEWTDGVLSSIFREFSNEFTENVLKWLVFDGPIESQWIEHLNVVLDDNRKLCLTSGEVLNLSPNTSIIFEVNSLNEASPSTVIIYDRKNEIPETSIWAVKTDFLSDFRCFLLALV